MGAGGRICCRSLGGDSERCLADARGRAGHDVSLLPKKKKKPNKCSKRSCFGADPLRFFSKCFLLKEGVFSLAGVRLRHTTSCFKTSDVPWQISSPVPFFFFFPVLEQHGTKITFFFFLNKNIYSCLNKQLKG